MSDADYTFEQRLGKADWHISEARSKRKEADILRARAEDAPEPDRAEAQAAIEAAFSVAEDHLSEAVCLLEPELKRRETHLESTPMAASQDRKELAVRLADCYGPLGGIARRKGDYRRALDFYGKGRQLELNSTYEIKSTYNRVQWIVAYILIDPSSIAPADGGVAGNAREILDLLLRGKGSDDAWKSADVLLLSALLGDRRQVKIAWESMSEAGATPDVYKSGLLVLCELANRLPNNDLLRYAVDEYNSKLPKKFRKYAH